MNNIRLPAEWEPQSGVMLTWPHEHTDWQPILNKVDAVFAEITRHISDQEKVLIVANDENHQAHIEKILTNSSIAQNNIIYSTAPSNDSWSRDHGPITIIDQDEPKLLDFQFNGWGKKYRCNYDNQISLALYNNRIFNNVSIKPVNLILEGGAIDSNGQGDLLTTDCLANPNRNARVNPKAMETYLRENLGVRKVHWLSHKGLSGDDTDGHIDTLARFVNENTIVYNVSNDPGDIEHDGLVSLEEQLKELRNQNDEPFELVPIPLPDPITTKNGDRLPATYTNFLIINNAVLVPVYSQAKDNQAISILDQAFPGRKVIGVNSLPLIEQFGSLHCVTMQIPHDVL